MVKFKQLMGGLLLGVAGLLATASPVCGQAIATSLVGTPPAPNTLDWFRWEYLLEKAILDRCPIDRTTKIYVDAAGGATSGSDANPGTIGSPFATIARAQTYIGSWSENSGGLSIYFNRGDVWEEAAGLDLTKSYITVADYGTGNKPFFNWFTNKWNIDGVDNWTLATGTSYTRTGATNLAEIRSQTDRLRGLTRCSSTAECDALLYSYHISGGTIRMNVGVDPDTIAWEYILTTATNDSGILTSATADRCRVHNLRLDGWGYTRSTSRQDYGVQFGGNGTTIFACTDTDMYFNDRHSGGHNGGGSGANTGGLGLWKNVVFGGRCSNQDATNFIAYCGGGLQEDVISGCSFPYGALADYNVRPAISGGSDKVYAYGVAGYAHTTTGGATAALLISLDSYIPAAADGQGCSVGIQWANAPTATTMAGYRSIEIGTRFEAAKGTGCGHNITNGLNTAGHLVGMPSTYHANNFWGFQPVDSGAETLVSTNGQDFATVVNTVLDVDLTRIPTARARYSLYNPTTDLTSSVRFWHDILRLRNPNLVQFHPNYDQTFADATTTSNAAGTEFGNSIASYERENPANSTAMRLGLVDSAAALFNNAYWLVSAGSGANLNGIANTVSPVALGGPMPVLTSNASVLLAGAGRGGLVEYDYYRRPRSMTAPTIGPVELQTDVLMDPTAADLATAVWSKPSVDMTVVDSAGEALIVGRDRVLLALPPDAPETAGGLAGHTALDQALQAIGIANVSLGEMYSQFPADEKTIASDEDVVAASPEPISPLAVNEARKWKPNPLDGSQAGNIVTVKAPFNGTLAALMPLNPDVDIQSITSVTITGPAAVTATTLRKSPDGREVHFNPAANVTTTGNYSVVVRALSVDGDDISMACRLVVK